MGPIADDARQRLELFLLNGGPSAGLDLSVPESIVNSDYLNHLEQLSHDDATSAEDVKLLYIGVSALRLFLQCNVVGPIPTPDGPLHARIANVVARLHRPFPISPGSPADNLDVVDSRAILNLDGESAYPLVRFPRLLLIAKNAFRRLCTSGFVSADWWRLRADWTHQLVLQEPVETLRASLLDTLAPKIVTFFSQGGGLSPKSPHRVLLHLELYHIYHYYSRSKDAVAYLESAVSLAGVDVRVTGALGKRTKWQSEDKSQLVVAVGSAGDVAGNQKPEVARNDELWWASNGDYDDNAERKRVWWHSDAPKNVALDDDTLLDKIKFRNEEEGGEEDSGWTPLDQAVVYCVMMNVGRKSCVRELTEEELSAFRTALLEQQRRIFGVQLGCLFYRSRGEKEKSRKVERALMQLEDLVGSLRKYEEEPSTATQRDSQTTTTVTTTTVTTGHRCFLVHALCLPFVWTVETLMADVMTSLGLTSAALDVYSRLEAWPSVVECYKKQGKRGAAEKLIRDKLDLTNDPNMLCILGDVTLDPSRYEEAWRVSNGKCARAMRTLGYDHLYKHRPTEAIDCFEKSIAVNALQIPVWYSLGCTTLMTEDHKKAEKAFLRCVHLDYDNYEAWSNLASAQIKLGNKEKACNTLQEALKCNYENWRIWENFLVVSTDVGRPEDVVRAYHRLLDLKGEKYVDSEVLTVLVTLVFKLRETVDDEDEANRCAFLRLEKKCRQLFGRVTSSVTDNADVWKAYGRLYLQLRPFTSSSSGNENDNDDEDDPGDRRFKGIQFLQRSFRCLTQKAGWELELGTVEETLTRANEILRLILDENEKDDGDAKEENASSSSSKCVVNVSTLSSLKMVARTATAKMDKKYGENPPSERAKTEVGVMKALLKDIDVRIDRMKTRRQ